MAGSLAAPRGGKGDDLTLIKGIGPVKARRIVESFGEDFDRVIDEEPERIAAVAKVPLQSVQESGFRRMAAGSQFGKIVFSH